MEFSYYIAQHLKKHKSAQPQDIVKQCYQAAYGAEHLLSDMDVAKKYFYSEYDSIKAEAGELYEELSEDVCRINLSAWKASGMPAEWLFNMFAHSASVPHGSKELFLNYLQTAEEVLCSQAFSVTASDLQEYLMKYKAMGMTAVHHSESYRENEHPAYRIVNKYFLRVLPILQSAVLLSQKDSARVIAIDGRAASGKSTMTELLQKVLGAGVIHMDDFFLPPALRSQERLTEPGANVHYERFCEEILPFITSVESFSYRIFDCSRMDYNGERTVTTSSWRIVEGSYSHHPRYGNYADLTVFLDVDAKEQIKRIVMRNGEKMAEMFSKRWIPMEEKYFEEYSIRDRADLII